MSLSPDQFRSWTGPDLEEFAHSNFGAHGLDMLQSDRTIGMGGKPLPVLSRNIHIGGYGAEEQTTLAGFRVPTEKDVVSFGQVQPIDQGKSLLLMDTTGAVRVPSSNDVNWNALRDDLANPTGEVLEHAKQTWPIDRESPDLLAGKQAHLMELSYESPTMGTFRRNYNLQSRQFED
jgi:hypothetical protein